MTEKSHKWTKLGFCLQLSVLIEALELREVFQQWARHFDGLCCKATTEPPFNFTIVRYTIGGCDWLNGKSPLIAMGIMQVCSVFSMVAQSPFAPLFRFRYWIVSICCSEIEKTEFNSSWMGIVISMLMRGLWKFCGLIDDYDCWRFSMLSLLSSWCKDRRQRLV